MGSRAKKTFVGGTYDKDVIFYRQRCKTFVGGGSGQHYIGD